MRVKSLKAKISSKRGMTRVEVLVAMSILMLIIFTFTPLFASYLGNIQRSGETTRRTYKKASLMERLLANSGQNVTGYEYDVNDVPLSFTAGDVTLTFGGAGTDVGVLYGKNITTDHDNEGSSQDYVTLITGFKSKKMVCFPTCLTDDFLEKTITVVPIGFDFATDSSGDFYTDENYWKIEYTNSSGNPVTVPEGYATIDPKPLITGQGDNIKKCAQITFKGANEIICFQNSPLIITYKRQ